MNSIPDFFVSMGSISGSITDTQKWNVRLFIGFLACIIIIIGISIAFKNYSKLSSPGTIARVTASQTAALETRWTGTTQKRQGISAGFQSENVPNDQRLLINTSVLGVRLTGCVGPYSSPVFDEAAATRFAIASGARCLILEIDHEEKDRTPKLIYRDAWGLKQSLNTGRLDLVARQIAGRAFVSGPDSTPPGVSEDPLIVVLYFVKTPNQAEEPLEYVRYLGKVAEAIQPLTPLLLGQTPQGDFRRQALESQLFYQPIDVVKKRVVILTNVDTTPFRRLKDIGLAGELGPRQDLDLLVHARLYARESPSGLGSTSTPVGTQQPAAVLTTPNYWINTPPDRLADSISQTKKAWTLVMPPVASDGDYPSKENLTKLLKTYGVHCVPLTLFDTDSIVNSVVGKDGVYQTSAWVAKPNLIRYIPLPPIITQKPFPQANAGGGAIRSPM